MKDLTASTSNMGVTRGGVLSAFLTSLTGSPLHGAAAADVSAEVDAGFTFGSKKGSVQKLINRFNDLSHADKVEPKITEPKVTDKSVLSSPAYEVFRNQEAKVCNELYEKLPELTSQYAATLPRGKEQNRFDARVMDFQIIWGDQNDSLEERIKVSRRFRDYLASVDKRRNTEGLKSCCDELTQYIEMLEHEKDFKKLVKKTIKRVNNFKQLLDDEGQARFDAVWMRDFKSFLNAATKAELIGEIEKLERSLESAALSALASGDKARVPILLQETREQWRKLRESLLLEKTTNEVPNSINKNDGQRATGIAESG